MGISTVAVMLNLKWLFRMPKLPSPIWTGGFLSVAGRPTTLDSSRRRQANQRSPFEPPSAGKMWANANNNFKNNRKLFVDK
jgi:hypothetical protein